jgi:hypothetical protein
MVLISLRTKLSCCIDDDSELLLALLLGLLFDAVCSEFLKVSSKFDSLSIVYSNIDASSFICVNEP